MQNPCRLFFYFSLVVLKLEAVERSKQIDLIWTFSFLWMNVVYNLGAKVFMIMIIDYQAKSRGSRNLGQSMNNKLRRMAVDKK